VARSHNDSLIQHYPSHLPASGTFLAVYESQSIKGREHESHYILHLQIRLCTLLFFRIATQDPRLYYQVVVRFFLFFRSKLTFKLISQKAIVIVNAATACQVTDIFLTSNPEITKLRDLAMAVTATGCGV
jgi:hypothetical protein